MITYEGLKIFLVVACILLSFGTAFYCITIWWLSRSTHIEPMKFEPKRTHKFPKIDISVAYQCAKVGQVLSARK